MSYRDDRRALVDESEHPPAEDEASRVAVFREDDLGHHDERLSHVPGRRVGTAADVRTQR
jgi:hypothetical protein